MRVSLWLVVVLGIAACDDGEGTLPADAAVVVDAAVADAIPEADGPLPDAAPMVFGALVIDTELVEFGTIGVGGRTDQMLQLRNEGEGELTVEGWMLEAPFSTSRTPPVRIPPGASRTLLLQFSPTDPGPAEAVMTINTDVPGAQPAMVTLRGEGLTAEGELVNDRVDFGVVAPGQPAAEFILVENTSEVAPLTINAVDGVMPPFEIPVGQVPVTVEPGQTAMMLVQFDPQEDGDFEQQVTVKSNGGEWEVTLAGRSLSVGDLVLLGVEPAWAPTDEAVTLVVHGGPFPVLPDEVLVGGQALEGLELVDDERVRGTLPAGGEPGPVDLRVDLAGTFGVRPAGLTRTGPVAMGRALDADALATGAIGPEGNPWRLEVDEVPGELTIATGTVVLCDGRQLLVSGTVRAGGDPGQVVFSAAARTPGSWAGVVLGADGAPSSFTDAVFEYAGSDAGAAVTTSQAASLARVAIRQTTGDGVAVAAGGTLVVQGGDFTDVTGTAMVLDPEATVFRVLATRVRRATWPMLGAMHQFANPLGAGNDWAGNEHAGIGLQGDVSENSTLGNQPAGVVFEFTGPTGVAEGVTLRFSSNAPLLLNQPLTVDGRLELPTGVRVQTGAGGQLVVNAPGAMSVQGTPAEPVVFEAREPDGDPAPGSWLGITIGDGVELAATRLTVRDAGADGRPALALGSDFDDVVGLVVEDSEAVGLELSGRGNLSSAIFGGNVGGTRITGGSGAIAGTTTDAAPAVTIEGVGCDAWDLSELVDGAGEAASVSCE